MGANVYGLMPISQNNNEKKYPDFALKLRKVRDTKVRIMPTISGAVGTMPRNWNQV